MAGPKLLAPKSIGISSETDRLTRATVAGLPSVEQELMQLYPTGKSLFLDRMDVQQARKELQAFANVLTQNGVDVVVMKEQLAQILGGEELSKDVILKALFKKADGIQEQYGLGGPAPVIKDKIAFLLELDSQIYGEAGALALAKALCLDPKDPLGNVIYARDQTNVVFGMRIVASMAYDIRVPEVALYECVYQAVLGDHDTIIIPKGEKFEGGSLYVHNGTVFMDVDPRTTWGAAMHIISELSKRYPDAKYAIVKNGNKGEAFEQQQQSMHLDTFSMPIGPNQIAVCEEEAEKRHVYLVERGKVIVTGRTFMGYLADEGYHISVVSKEEQNSFGCNILMLDASTAFMPLAHSVALLQAGNDFIPTTKEPGIMQALRDSGKSVITVPMEATTNGFGATHCAVGQLKRE